MNAISIKTNELRLGDIIVAKRFFYDHYGIYAGNEKVIHYASDSGDFGANAKVRETSLKQFVRDSEYEILQFNEKKYKEKLFSREETVSRARSRKGENNYNLIFSNCEHFAFWCKTGINKSVQVEKAFITITLVGAMVALANIFASSDKENK